MKSVLFNMNKYTFDFVPESTKAGSEKLEKVKICFKHSWILKF